MVGNTVNIMTEIHKGLQMGEMLERRKDQALWSDKAGLKCRPQGLWLGGVWGVAEASLGR